MEDHGVSAVKMGNTVDEDGYCVITDLKPEMCAHCRAGDEPVGLSGRDVDLTELQSHGLGNYPRERESHSTRIGHSTMGVENGEVWIQPAEAMDRGHFGHGKRRY